jgi:hypothetical protein
MRGILGMVVICAVAVSACGGGGEQSSGPPPPPPPEPMLSVLAGGPGGPGNADGTGATVRFNGPVGVATDSAGNVYVADTGNDIIRKTTSAGVVTTLAGMAGARGSADGTAAAARFNQPQGVATDSVGNVYMTDTGNDTIRKISPAGLVSTIAGQPGEIGFVPGPLPGLLSAPTSVTLFGTTLYTTTNDAIVQINNVP